MGVVRATHFSHTKWATWAGSWVTFCGLGRFRVDIYHIGCRPFCTRPTRLPHHPRPGGYLPHPGHPGPSPIAPPAPPHLPGRPPLIIPSPILPQPPRSPHHPHRGHLPPLPPNRDTAPHAPQPRIRPPSQPRGDHPPEHCQAPRYTQRARSTGQYVRPHQLARPYLSPGIHVLPQRPPCRGTTPYPSSGPSSAPPS